MLSYRSLFFRYILQHKEIKNLEYYHSFNSALTNTRHLFEVPYVVNTVQAVRDLYHTRVSLKSLWKEASTGRPDSKWSVIAITNVSCFVTHRGGLLDWGNFSDSSDNDDDETDAPPPPPPSPSPVGTVLPRGKKYKFKKKKKEAKFGHSSSENDEEDEDEDEDEQVERGLYKTVFREDQMFYEQILIDEKEEGKQALLETKSYGEDLCFFYALAYLHFKVDNDSVAKRRPRSRMKWPPASSNRKKRRGGASTSVDNGPPGGAAAAAAAAVSVDPIQVRASQKVISTMLECIQNSEIVQLFIPV